MQKLKIDTLNIINNSDCLPLLFIFMIPPCCYLRSLSLIESRGIEWEFKVFYIRIVMYQSVGYFCNFASPFGKLDLYKLLRFQTMHQLVSLPLHIINVPN